MMKFLSSCYLVLLLFLFIGAQSLRGATYKSMVVAPTVNYINGLDAPYNLLLPGDTLKLQYGTRDQLLIQNLTGDSDHPIVITNGCGVVGISTENHYGMSIRNCRYLKVTGTGFPNEFYGIQIKKVEQGAGIGINDFSSDIEIDHLSIQNTLFNGINAKTDPDLATPSTREKFTQFNTIIHDCSISDTGNEGMYIGNTKYEGVIFDNNGQDTLLMPSLLDGVQIYNNILTRTGWDGIQVSSATKGCQIFGNIISYDSQEAYYSQMSGIMLGGGSKCDCYNNLISNGKGSGIEVHGLGGFKVFNNIIINAGRSYLPTDPEARVYGMYVSDISVERDSSFQLLFNTIIRPKTDGIRFSSMLSKNNLIASNLIAEPGAFHTYQSGNTSYTGADAFVMIPNDTGNVTLSHNFFSMDLTRAYVDTSTYKPLEISPLIDHGLEDMHGIMFDFNRNNRLNGSTPDIGAIEFNHNSDKTSKYWPSFLNPVKTMLQIKYTAEVEIKSNLLIYNKEGQVIMRKEQANGTTSIQNIELDIEHLPASLYLFSLVSGNNHYSGKFIKLDP